MNIIPSIDLQDGRCVRLKKGQFNQVTIYEDAPTTVIKQYEAAGAKYIHIVDLDGAKDSSVSQLNNIISLKQATNLNMQVGGGIRTADSVKKLLSGGIDKIVLGSLAISDPNYTKRLLEEFGATNFVLAFDVKLDSQNTPFVAINGWQTETEQTLWQVIDNYISTGIQDVLCTDINKDGMLSGPNFNLYNECTRSYPNLKFQASGGIRNSNDIQALTKAGLSASIIGKALFENKITLAEALAGDPAC